MVAKYANISLFEVFELDVFEFFYLLRDAVIYSLSLTKEGQKYLDKCWRLQQTDADVEGLRKKFGKGE